MKLLLKIFWLIVALVIVTGVISWGLNYQTNLPAPDSRTEAEIKTLLLNERPELFTANNKPIFTIKSIVKPQVNWYIVHLSPGHDNDPDSFTIINDPFYGSNYMHVVLGPESKFSKQELSAQYVPGPVVDSLTKAGAL